MRTHYCSYRKAEEQADDAVRSNAWFGGNISRAAPIRKRWSWAFHRRLTVDLWS